MRSARVQRCYGVKATLPTLGPPERLPLLLAQDGYTSMGLLTYSLTPPGVQCMYYYRRSGRPNVGEPFLGLTTDAVIDQNRCANNN